jgi:hypothetical protein
MLPLLLAQIGLPLLVKAVGGALSNSSNPVAQAAGQALGQVDTEISTGRLDGDQVKEANRHMEAVATLEANTDQTWLKEVNQTIRAETTSEDAYVRRMRPTFGYIMAFTWAAQMGAIAYTVVADPQQAAPVIAAVASLGTIWTVGLSVLGIYVYRRSGEKQRALSMQSGDQPSPQTGLLQSVLNTLIQSKSKEK